MTKHFLSLQDFTKTELAQIITNAIQRKKEISPLCAQGKVLGMIFEKASTRTRVSFEAGMSQLGGHAIFLSSDSSQIGRGEPVEDTARVLSSMVDIIMVRTFSHETLEVFSDYSTVPVINALTDMFHPCQLLADMQTFQECRGSISGKTVTWVGDGNNMCNSYINAAEQFDFNLRIACPKGYEPQLTTRQQQSVIITQDVKEACSDTHLIVTDVWASMGQENESDKRVNAFKGFQVNHDLIKVADKDVIFMHCLPAHREEEVSSALLEDQTYSVVWQEAENRLHAQKELMRFLLNI
jgi:ornithine carbamoyltransferase